MEQNDIYYVIFPVRLPLRDFSFIQIILFLNNAKMSVLFLSLCFLFCVVFSHIQDNVRWLPQFATKWLSFCIRLSFEPTRTIWTQKLFPLIVSSWKSHFLECIEPVQKEMAFLWRVIKQRLLSSVWLDSLASRACVTYLLALLCDDVIKTNDWRKKERATNISMGQKQTGSRQAEPDEGIWRKERVWSKADAAD